ncbi:hypothetical protein ICM_02428 [Bacillus cereus BAG1X2-3]|nr:hypothetical protein ICC_02384 [Bacillus cereus BAG1X1-1]EOO47982.1 hypothetical protein ICI_02994 [Bacillus cereus BAG1X2-1]EOO53313.1 hypothetical protein ICK_02363 [Bacillus cereus BAG1X2-2]EOO58946.1 hypothetical protein ICM_02428 [Bacillus cereus BAG1X2-3]EOP04955.1 hypothetical protein ICO_02988 [Bacillus cereus BAG2O-1]
MKFHHLHHVRPSGNKKLNDYTNTLTEKTIVLLSKNVEGLSFIFLTKLGGDVHKNG